MKKLLLFPIGLFLLTVAMAQEETEEKKSGFKKENMFIGGGLNLGGGSRSFTVGIMPEVGYSITNWLDAGIAFNLNYQTQKIEDNFGYVWAKYRSLNYGAGPFVRIWPVNFLHLAFQPEYNWIDVTTIETVNNQKTKASYRAPSYLVGIGYGNREVGRQLSYFTVMIDLGKNINSPYRDQYNHAQPVFRTGVGFYLGRKR